MDVNCPICNGPMVERQSARGDFFGCLKYPACKGTVDISDIENGVPQLKHPGVPPDPWGRMANELISEFRNIRFELQRNNEAVVDAASAIRQIWAEIREGRRGDERNPSESLRDVSPIHRCLLDYWREHAVRCAIKPEHFPK